MPLGIGDTWGNRNPHCHKRSLTSTRDQSFSNLASKPTKLYIVPTQNLDATILVNYFSLNRAVEMKSEKQGGYNAAQKSYFLSSGNNALMLHAHSYAQSMLRFHREWLVRLVGYLLQNEIMCAVKKQRGNSLCVSKEGEVEWGMLWHTVHLRSILVK